MDLKQYRIDIKFSITDISKENWLELDKDNTNPFFYWEWLANLESSNSVSTKTGWQPLYFITYLNNEICSIAPLFLKNHSYGEFIFDQSFANLARDLNLNYYPKLIGMSPYSPVEGYKFLYKDNIDKSEVTKLLIDYIDQFAIKNNILSCNFLYVDEEWGKNLSSLGYYDWINLRSEWERKGENNFEDFLLRFNSNQRRNIKKERNYILQKNIEIEALTQEKISLEVIKNMYHFYEEHCLKWGVWGSKYLTSDFFENILVNKENILIFSALSKETDKIIAMSMCVKNDNKLWGRYWGCNEEVNNLHFELCYYQPIDWAIKNKINNFDPGAGGKHKRRRGFLAKSTKSFHKWFDKNMENIIGEWLLKSNPQRLKEIALENNSIPFK